MHLQKGSKGLRVAIVFNVKPRTNHGQKVRQYSVSDGGAVSQRNADGRFTVDASDYSEARSAFTRCPERLGGRLRYY